MNVKLLAKRGRGLGVVYIQVIFEGTSSKKLEQCRREKWHATIKNLTNRMILNANYNKMNKYEKRPNEKRTNTVVDYTGCILETVINCIISRPSPGVDCSHHAVFATNSPHS